MTLEQQRIAIAEACGWQRIYAGRNMGSLYGFKKGNHRAHSIPDYLNDLNAIHQAWRTLTHRQKTRFESELYSVVIGQTDYNQNDDAPYITNANAAQRAEAFLRSVKLWEVTE